MKYLLPTVQFDTELLKKYDQPLPRYTSYPPATELKPDFGIFDYKQAIAALNQRSSPLSLYVHIPFCQSACYFCGCNVIVSNNKNIALSYLEYLTKEIEQTAARLDSSKPVVQMHWGGGTPNYLTIEQVERVWKTINQNFDLATDAEISIEINPRYVDQAYIQALRDIGFNRVSFGIQDFNPQVQAAVNRVQPEELLFNVMDWVRQAQFDSVNVDLIYGLPYQTLQTFEETIQNTIDLNSDRLAIFNFAYVPWLKPVQKNISEATLPSPQEKLEIVQMAIAALSRNGYVYIGMDHFAKPDDELAVAQRNGTLKRNFQGYTTQPDAELIGFGLSSISMLHDAYFQNHKRLQDYYQAVDCNQPPVEKGISLHRDDIIRREIIMQLMCHFGLSKPEIEAKHHLEFDAYFASELVALKALEADGLVRLFSNSIDVSPTGRLLIRNIASVFDSYLRDRVTSPENRIVANFSRAI
ncbi:oxygen-independent coproporphyrinogen III oxidase [Oculatella sp. LEGE 06141]|uniref:oxygen-independent coproporphyrinogen III oxidase n=1 Tax=Oculatella sp. LEGE 06141 TaxID=1828648 RepID=UPI001880B266|nr:oxygen-independent coproporphyrinogen III oxidase [Oculatella sp. LEGE 06141]MBE9181701.1 oxygen-independent coproporphyrinogen III oxidase [Oculatella sp. LEGE 06141]